MNNSVLKSERREMTSIPSMGGGFAVAQSRVFGPEQDNDGAHVWTQAGLRGQRHNMDGQDPESGRRKCKKGKRPSAEGLRNWAKWEGFPAEVDVKIQMGEEGAHVQQKGVPAPGGWAWDVKALWGKGGCPRVGMACWKAQSPGRVGRVLAQRDKLARGIKSPSGWERYRSGEEAAVDMGNGYLHGGWSKATTLRFVGARFLTAEGGIYR